MSNAAENQRFRITVAWRRPVVFDILVDAPNVDEALAFAKAHGGKFIRPAGFPDPFSDGPVVGVFDINSSVDTPAPAQLDASLAKDQSNL